MILTRLLLPLALAGLPGAAVAMDGLRDIVCMARAQLEERLGERDGAQRVGVGLAAPDALIEVWAHPETGSWTMVRMHADGRSCIVALGSAWDLPDAGGDKS